MTNKEKVRLWSLWLDKILSLQTRTNWWQRCCQKTATRSTKIFLRMSTTWEKELGNLDAHEIFSWSQTQYCANRIAITKLQDTHSTNVDLDFLQQVTKSRNKTCTFPTSVFWTGKPWVKTCSSCEGSQLHQKARERNKHAVKKKYTRMLERYRKKHVVSTESTNKIVNEKQVKAWDRLAEGPKREHVATAAECDHW